MMQQPHQLNLNDIEIHRNVPPPPRFDPVDDLLKQMQTGDWVSLPTATAKEVARIAQSRGVPTELTPVSGTHSSVQIVAAQSSTEMQELLAAWWPFRSTLGDFWCGSAREVIVALQKTEHSAQALCGRLTPKTTGKALAAMSRFQGSGVTLIRSDRRRGNVYELRLDTLGAEQPAAA